ALSGTSMATSHVAGVTALWWEDVLASPLPATSQTVLARLIANATMQGLAPAANVAARGVGLARAPSVIEHYLTSRQTGSALGDALEAPTRDRARPAIPSQTNGKIPTGLRLQLQASEPDLVGTPVVVDVLDHDLRVVAQQAVPVGVQHDFDLPAGDYGLR